MLLGKTKLLFYQMKYIQILLLIINMNQFHHFTPEGTLISGGLSKWCGAGDGDWVFSCPKIA